MRSCVCIVGLVVLTSLLPLGVAHAASPAALVVQQLQETTLADYTIDTDPDQLLGLPGQYTSRAAFAIGSVEVFGSPVDRDLRSRLLSESSTDLLYRADFSSASILLRLSNTVDPITANTLGRRLRSMALLFQ